MPEFKQSTSGLPGAFPDGCVFIIDGLTSALTAALVAQHKPIRCIYECKRVEWRKVDFVALYDLLLADRDIEDLRVVDVPHPYWFGVEGNINIARWQRRFIRDLAKDHHLDPTYTYVGCVTSSLLLANKGRVNHILMDEGMDSLMARHHLYRRGEKGLTAALRAQVASILFPFRFSSATPQVTLANDPHPAVALHLDYRDFHSSAFGDLTRSLQSRLKEGGPNVLTLVKGPPHNSARPFSQNLEDYEDYVTYNADQIREFMDRETLTTDARFFLKAHPSLGRNSPLIRGIIAKLKPYGVHAADLAEGIEFSESPSIPAEVYLAAGGFARLLSLEPSSTLWHVGHVAPLKCHLPLTALLSFVRQHESSALLRLYGAQNDLNQLNGNHVHIY